jgi:hypothetical protein
MSWHKPVVAALVNPRASTVQAVFKAIVCGGGKRVRRVASVLL